MAEPHGARLSEIGFQPLGRATTWRDGAARLLAVRIARELEAPDEHTPLAVEGLLLELAAAAARQRKADRPAPAWLATVRDFLHEHFSERIRLADVAAAAGVHPTHLARVFRARLGISVAAYVRELRLDWAAGQLLSTDEPLAAIARDAGFSDQSHFTRAFSAYTGLSPGRYRTTLRI